MQQTTNKLEPMVRAALKLIIVGSLLLTSRGSLSAAEVADGTVKVTSRMVAPGIGLSWGEGVLRYKNQDYPFTFKATGLFRDVDAKITAAELSGRVFELKRLEDFSGNYKKVAPEDSAGGADTRATLKNQKGVVLDLVSAVEGRKFTLAREGMDIELKKHKP